MKWNAIRLAMRQRFSIFNVNANYSFQENAGDLSWDGAFATPSNNYDLAAEWASVPRHSLNLSINSRLPLGLFLTTSYYVRNGNPYSITTGKDDNGDGIVNDRPPGVGRLTKIGPWYQSVDLNISKAFQMTHTQNGGGANLNVFANMTNALNKTNLGTPSGVITSPFFGKSTYASNPREIEVGARFQF
jgi:outer membrane receptor protein involved in Fe transport